MSNETNRNNNLDFENIKTMLDSHSKIQSDFIRKAEQELGEPLHLDVNQTFSKSLFSSLLANSTSFASATQSLSLDLNATIPSHIEGISYFYPNLSKHNKESLLNRIKYKLNLKRFDYDFNVQVPIYNPESNHYQSSLNWRGFPYFLFGFFLYAFIFAIHYIQVPKGYYVYTIVLSFVGLLIFLPSLYINRRAMSSEQTHPLESRMIETGEVYFDIMRYINHANATLMKENILHPYVPNSFLKFPFFNITPIFNIWNVTQTNSKAFIRGNNLMRFIMETIFFISALLIPVLAFVIVRDLERLSRNKVFIIAFLGIASAGALFTNVGRSLTMKEMWEDYCFDAARIYVENGDTNSNNGLYAYLPCPNRMQKKEIVKGTFKIMITLQAALIYSKVRMESYYPNLRVDIKEVEDVVALEKSGVFENDFVFEDLSTVMMDMKILIELLTHLRKCQIPLEFVQHMIDTSFCEENQNFFRKLIVSYAIMAIGALIFGFFIYMSSNHLTYDYEELKNSADLEEIPEIEHEDSHYEKNNCDPNKREKRKQKQPDFLDSLILNGSNMQPLTGPLLEPQLQGDIKPALANLEEGVTGFQKMVQLEKNAQEAADQKSEEDNTIQLDAKSEFQNENAGNSNSNSNSNSNDQYEDNNEYQNNDEHNNFLNQNLNQNSNSNENSIDHSSDSQNNQNDFNQYYSHWQQESHRNPLQNDQSSSCQYHNQYQYQQEYYSSECSP